MGPKLLLMAQDHLATLPPILRVHAPMLGSALDSVPPKLCSMYSLSSQCLSLPLRSSGSGSPDPQREFRKCHMRRKAVLSPAGFDVGIPGHSEETESPLEQSLPFSPRVALPGILHFPMRLRCLLHITGYMLPSLAKHLPSMLKKSPEGRMIQLTEERRSQWISDEEELTILRMERVYFCF